ncbi:NifB/NifX family molybdenum-iron cluster-binding protein [Nautilia lithotrophica]
MKLAITASGAFIGSNYCPDFEECEYLIIYDTKTKEYAARKSPSFYSKNPEDLINFLKAVMIKNIISGKDIKDGYFKVFKVIDKDLSVEEVIMRYKEERSSYL